MLQKLVQRVTHRTESGLPVYLIVGLGNPGREYKETRHNVGFMVIDRLCSSFNIQVNKLQSKALIGSVTFHEKRLILAKPQTYMNLSGQAVSQLLRFYRIPMENLLVIHDDLDIPFGTLRMRPDGGPGGQKGLASIIQQLGTQDFNRLRIGIGRPPGRMEAADYVLQSFSRDESEFLNVMLDLAGDAVKMFLDDGIQYAMNKYNGAAFG